MTFLRLCVICSTEPFIVHEIKALAQDPNTKKLMLTENELLVTCAGSTCPWNVTGWAGRKFSVKHDFLSSCGLTCSVAVMQSHMIKNIFFINQRSDKRCFVVTTQVSFFDKATVCVFRSSNFLCLIFLFRCKRFYLNGKSRRLRVYSFYWSLWEHFYAFQSLFVNKKKVG